MKSSKVNLVTAFRWLENVLETRDLPSAQQLVLFQLTIAFNRQFWKPTPLSLNKLAAACNKDKRTVKSALEKLIESGLVVESEGGFSFGIDSTGGLDGINKKGSIRNRQKEQGRYRNDNAASGQNVNVEIDSELAKQFG